MLIFQPCCVGRPKSWSNEEREGLGSTYSLGDLTIFDWFLGKSVVAQYPAETENATDFDKINIVSKENQKFPRLIQECIETIKHPQNINGYDG